jgi:hypothetical protein
MSSGRASVPVKNHDAVTFDTTNAQTERPYKLTYRCITTDARPCVRALCYSIIKSLADMRTHSLIFFTWTTRA